MHYIRNIKQQCSDRCSKDITTAIPLSQREFIFFFFSPEPEKRGFSTRDKESLPFWSQNSVTKALIKRVPKRQRQRADNNRSCEDLISTAALATFAHLLFTMAGGMGRGTRGFYGGLADSRRTREEGAPPVIHAAPGTPLPGGAGGGAVGRGT